MTRSPVVRGVPYFYGFCRVQVFHIDIAAECTIAQRAAGVKHIWCSQNDGSKRILIIYFIVIIR
ncbi:hypothetical protein D3C85_1461750 [compost metagenome]